MSVILCLNGGWSTDDGGALRLYLDTEDGRLDVVPRGGRLVVFRSDGFHHEVAPAARLRMSLTGWLRTRS